MAVSVWRLRRFERERPAPSRQVRSNYKSSFVKLGFRFVTQCMQDLHKNVSEKGLSKKLVQANARKQTVAVLPPAAVACRVLFCF